MQASVAKILKSTENDFTFSGSFTDLDGATHNYILYNNVTFRQILQQLFGQRTYNDWDDETELSELVADFNSSYSVWMNTRKSMFMARLYALDQKFNPLENYRSHEERAGSFTHGETVGLSYTNRKDITKDDSYVERTHTDFKETTTDDSYIERTHTDFKETTTDDSYVERTHTDFKETTTDDSYVERSFDDYKETTTDDSYVEHSNDQYKETTKDDSSITKSYTNYLETETPGTITRTHTVSADDASTFVNSSQDTESQTASTKGIAGSVTDQHGYTTNGITKEITGSTKDQNGFTDGRIVEQSGTYKDQHGQTENGLVKETSGSYKDQHGYTDGIIRETSGSYKDQHGYTDGIIRETSGSYRDTKGFTNGLVNEKLGTETTTHSGTDLDGYTLERYGNIGVTTSQQMLASDLDLLRYDIVMIAIKEFISQYTYISCEVD